MQLLQTFAQVAGVGAVGICDFRALAPHCTPAQQQAIARQVAQPTAVLVGLFPYHTPPAPGNLSCYARGRDYHAVLADALAPFVAQLQATYPAHQFRVLVDASPLPEVVAAALCGLGCIGDNHLLLHPTYGSEVFIGTILTDCPLPTQTVPLQGCLHCGACARACPVGLSCADCLSALTQYKGELTPAQSDLLRAHPLIWGCDTCQTCCPMNRDLPTTKTPAFAENLLPSLTRAQVEGLTRKQFLTQFPDRAFTWRGPAPLLRNLNLK